MHVKNSAMVFLLFLLLPFAVFAQDSVGEEDKSTDSHLLFLQDTTVLLGKGDQRFGTSFSIASDEQRILTSLVSRRIFSSVLSYSLGVGYGAEFFASTVAISEKTKIHDFFVDTSEEKEDSRFDNVSIGLKKAFFAQNADYPELVGSLSFSSPLNGNSESYQKDISITIGTTVIKSVDPVFLYGGISITKTFGGGDNIYGTRFGSAFAVNHKIAFGGEISMSIVSGNKATLSPTSVFTLRETYSVNKKFSIEPSISIGLSGASLDNVFGISFSWGL